MSGFDALARHPRPVTLVPGPIDLSLIAAKVVVGLLTGSLALVSDAVHSGLDLMASILAFVAIRASEQPADVDHPYGHGRAENLAAYTEGILLLLAAAVIEVPDVSAGGPGIKEERSVRVRGAGPGLIGEVEVAGRRTLSLEAAEDLVGRVEQAVAERLPNLKLTVLVKASVDKSQFVERVHAVAAHSGVFRDLHDVVVEQEADGSLHLSLHAKLPS